MRSFAPKRANAAPSSTAEPLRASRADPPAQTATVQPAARHDIRHVPIAAAFPRPTAQLASAPAAYSNASAPAPSMPNPSGLPTALKSGIEALSGFSMDGVRVHYNSAKPARLLARAYAQGSEIHLGPGQERHLAHEAWHVVQQAQGRVRPTMQMKAGVPVNDDAGLEREADVMAARTMQPAPSPETIRENTLTAKPYKPAAALRGTGAPVQRILVINGISLTKHNYLRQLQTKENLGREWETLTSSQKETLKGLIAGVDRIEADTFAEVLDPTAGPMIQSSDAGLAPTSGPATKTIATPYGEMTLKVVNDSGGYHIILEHPQRADMIIRQRKDNKATSIDRGLQNNAALANNLKRLTDVIRTPQVERFSDQAYSVERVDRSIDALEMWGGLQGLPHESPERQMWVKRLHAIAEVFQANIEAAMSNELEPYPDFRPANVGEKAGAEQLIYIDFDQEGEVKDLGTLADQAMEWAGRRYQQDPGGPRDANPELYKHITGGRLGAMPGATTAKSGGGSHPVYEAPESKMPIATSTSLAPVWSAAAVQDSLPGAEQLEGYWGSGALRIRSDAVPPHVNVSEDAIIQVHGVPKRIHYVSEYEGILNIDYVDATDDA